MELIHHYHAWNMPVPRMEYISTTHGICLYHAWNMPASQIEYASKYMERVYQYHEYFSCMKCATIPCMEYMDSIWNCAPYA